MIEGVSYYDISATINNFFANWFNNLKKMPNENIKTIFEHKIENLVHNAIHKSWNLWLFICCKTKLKKKYFFLKKYLFFTKYTLFAEKNVFIWKKKFYIEIFLLKKTFFTEKNINENVKNIYLISEIYFYTENVCVTNKI